MKILLADKNPYDLEALRGGIQGPGCDVVTATDGREVMAAVASEAPDVIVANASLGQMGAMALSRDLKMFGDVEGNPASPKIVILLERPSDAWLANWARADRVLNKPVTPEQIAQVCEELVARPLGS